MDFPSLEGQGSSALGCLSVMWRQGDFCLVSRNKQAGSLCRAPEVRNLFWCCQLQDRCPCFRCLWGHVVLCPSTGTKLGHNYLSPKLLSLMYWLWGSKSFPPLSSSQLRPCLTSSANLTWYMQSRSKGSTGTALQLGLSLPNVLVSNIFGVKKEKKL